MKPRVALPAPGGVWEGDVERYFTTSVAAVEWIPVDHATTYGNYHLAELHQSPDWPVYPLAMHGLQGEIARYDAVRAKVTITPAVPAGFPDTPDVHVDWYDPDNTVANLPTQTPTNDGHGVRDNLSTLSLETPTLEFGPPDNAVKWSYHRISNSRFGDNFIVAVHPNEGLQSSYRFKPGGQGGRVLSRMELVDASSGGGEPSWEEQWFELSGSLRTSVLTIYPTVDIDTDSDNDIVIQRSEAEEEAENDPEAIGKRMFVNIDDDDVNGKADVIETDVFPLPDDDLEPAILDFGLDTYQGLAGYKLVLHYASETRIWASDQKDPLVADEHDPLARTYTWTIGENWDGANPPHCPKEIWVEGTGLAESAAVSWMVQTPGGAALASDEVKFSVEKVVWPFTQPQLSDWNIRHTSQWNGLELAPAWYIDKALEDYINNPEDRGTIETIHPDMEIGGVPAASEVGQMSATSGPASIGGTYAFGFVMEFDYVFETSRNPTQWGYIQADHWDNYDEDPELELTRKLSFVGNSGIKFGAIEATGDPFEAAILDVESMVSLAGGLDEFDPSNGGGINVSGTVSIPLYRPEPLNKLMTGVRYGGDYRRMVDNPGHIFDPPEDPADADEYYDTLLNNHGHANGHMNIDVTRIDQTEYYRVDIYLDRAQVPCYSEYVRLTTAGIGALSVQSHWASGVVFNDMSVIKKEP